MSAEEATINPDGTQTMGEDAAADAGADYADATADAGAGADDADDADAGEEDFGEGAEEAAEEVIKGTDPAIFLLLGFALIAGLWFVSWYKKKKEDEESDSFFTELDGEKVSWFRSHRQRMLLVSGGFLDWRIRAHHVCCIM